MSQKSSVTPPKSIFDCPELYQSTYKQFSSAYQRILDSICETRKKAMNELNKHSRGTGGGKPLKGILKNASRYGETANASYIPSLNNIRKSLNSPLKVIKDNLLNLGTKMTPTTVATKKSSKMFSKKNKKTNPKKKPVDVDETRKIARQLVKSFTKDQPRMISESLQVPHNNNQGKYISTDPQPSTFHHVSETDTREKANKPSQKSMIVNKTNSLYGIEAPSTSKQMQFQETQAVFTTSNKLFQMNSSPVATTPNTSPKPVKTSETNMQQEGRQHVDVEFHMGMHPTAIQSRNPNTVSNITNTSNITSIKTHQKNVQGNGYQNIGASRKRTQSAAGISPMEQNVHHQYRSDLESVIYSSSHLGNVQTIDNDQNTETFLTRSSPKYTPNIISSSSKKPRHDDDILSIIDLGTADNAKKAVGQMKSQELQLRNTKHENRFENPQPSGSKIKQDTVRKFLLPKSKSQVTPKANTENTSLEQSKAKSNIKHTAVNPNTSIVTPMSSANYSLYSQYEQKNVLSQGTSNLFEPSFLDQTPKLSESIRTNLQPSESSYDTRVAQAKPISQVSPIVRSEQGTCYSLNAINSIYGLRQITKNLPQNSSHSLTSNSPRISIHNNDENSQRCVNLQSNYERPTTQRQQEYSQNNLDDLVKQFTSQHGIGELYRIIGMAVLKQLANSPNK